MLNAKCQMPNAKCQMPMPMPHGKCQCHMPNANAKCQCQCQMPNWQLVVVVAETGPLMAQMPHSNLAQLFASSNIFFQFSEFEILQCHWQVKPYFIDAILLLLYRVYNLFSSFSTEAGCIARNPEYMFCQITQKCLFIILYFSNI